MMLIGYANYMMLGVLVLFVWYTSILSILLLMETKKTDDINLHVMSIYGVIYYVSLSRFHIILLYLVLVCASLS